MITFEELGVHPDHVRALSELGFEFPMPVQEKVIPLLLGKDTDIVVLAQTGTGKTAAYGLPLIQQISAKHKTPQALVICPTRELCIQITGDLNDFAKYAGDLKILPVYGGSSMEVQIKALKKGVQIVIATPGRLLDLIRRKAIKLNDVKKVILDEADEMLNMGFIDSINDILAEVPTERNTLLFSATMPNEVAVIAKKFMHHPVEITIGNRNSGAENIKHIYYTVHARDKYLALKRLVDFYPAIYGIVFCRTRRETQEVADKLIHDGYNAEALHGELSQGQRDIVMQKFRIGHVQLLVATDVAARGIDVDNLTHIINYNLPDDLDAYTHRSGRTGRAGKMGTSIAIINLKEKHLIRQIEKKINKTFTAGKVPGGREICEKQLFNMINKMEKVELEHMEIDSYLPAIYRKLEWIEKEDVIKRFVALEFNRFLEYYKDAVDINALEDKNHPGGKFKYGEKNGFESVAGYTRLFINKGKMDGLFPNTLIELINEYTPGKKIPIGKIDLNKSSATFEVDGQAAVSLIKALQKAKFRGVPLIVKEDKKSTSFIPRSSDDKKPRRDFHSSGPEKRKKRKNFSR